MTTLLIGVQVNAIEEGHLRIITKARSRMTEEYNRILPDASVPVRGQPTAADVSADLERMKLVRHLLVDLADVMNCTGPSTRVLGFRATYRLVATIFTFLLCAAAVAQPLRPHSGSR